MTEFSFLYRTFGVDKALRKGILFEPAMNRVHYVLETSTFLLCRMRSSSQRFLVMPYKLLTSQVYYVAMTLRNPDVSKFFMAAFACVIVNLAENFLYLKTNFFLCRSNF